MNDAIPEFPAPTAAESVAERKRLFDIVKDSADKNRNYFLGWLLFALYVLVTVAGTSDTQLLLPDIGVSLPVLGIQLPLFSFYLAAPLLVIAIHFNLLQNLDSHAYKLDRWRAAWNGSPPRDELQAFLFDFALLERGAAFEIPVRIASDVLFYWFGPIVLFAILIRFSDYQNAHYTEYHFVALLVGLFVTLRARNHVPMAPSVRRHGRRVLPYVVAVLIALLALPTVWLTWALSASSLPALRIMSTVVGRSDGSDFLHEFIAPRLIIPASAQLPGPDAQAELKAKTEGRTVDEWWRDQGHGVDLRGRSLLFAIFNGVDLRKADFKAARLVGAGFDNVRLQGAALQGAQLTAASFFNTQAQGADFLMANLRAASFVNTDLTAANLYQSAMEGAWFQQVRFTAAVLEVSTFSGASFQDVVNVSLDAQQTGQVLKLSSKTEDLDNDMRRELERRLPNVQAVQRLKKTIVSNQSPPPNIDPSTLSADARAEALDGLVRTWCWPGPFLPTMVDRVLSGWPGIDAVWAATDDQRRLSRDLRLDLFDRLVRHESCAPYSDYVCGRLATKLDYQQPALWPDLQKACEGR